MNGIESQILMALVDIVKAGGFYAILGILIWGILPVIKTLGISLLAYLAVRLVYGQTCNVYLLRRFNKGLQINLLSKQTSKSLDDAIKVWRKESERSTKELLRCVEDLRKSSAKSEMVKPASIDS